MYTRKLVYDTIRSIDSATFTGAYQTLGTSFSNAMSLIKIVNNSGALITISTDGVNDMDVIPANSFTLYDITTNAPEESGSIFVPIGTQYYVKASASTGLVYLVCQYVQTKSGP